MSRTTRIAPLGVLALAALSFAAAAANGGANPGAASGRMLQKMDTNGDGRVSLDEYLAAAGARFAAIDSQHKGSIDAADIASSPAAIERIDQRAARLVRRLDGASAGYVTLDEFVAAAQKRFARLDRNGDGRLTPDELVRHGRGGAAAAPRAGARFERLDANHDGVVTLDEYVAAARTLYAQFDAQHDGKVTASEIATSTPTQKRAVHVAAAMVRHMDANGDGRVTRDEFMAAAKSRFQRLDANGDGYLDASELAGHRRGPRT